MIRKLTVPDKNVPWGPIYPLSEPELKVLKEYIDTMNPSRAHYYDTWFKVICALAYISPTYVELARYFSMKSNKYNAVDFTRIWNSILHSKSKNPSSIGTIKHYASLDNPERYAEIQKTSIFNVLYKISLSGRNKNHQNLKSITGEWFWRIIKNIVFKLLHCISTG